MPIRQRAEAPGWSSGQGQKPKRHPGQPWAQGKIRCMLGFCFLGHFCTCEGKKVRGTLGGTLTVRCAYGPGWESYKKWLCRGTDWDSCKILVKTTGSEQLVKKGQVSIQDNHSRRTFTMTLEDLQQDDADTYWCGIEQFGTDVGIEFSVIVSPGKNHSSCALGSWDPPPEESGLFLCLPP